MLDMMDQAHRLAAPERQRALHRLGRIEQALPGHGPDLVGDRSLVESEIAAPERIPAVVIAGLQRTDGDFAHDAGSPAATGPYRYSGASGRSSTSAPMSLGPLRRMPGRPLRSAGRARPHH